MGDSSVTDSQSRAADSTHQDLSWSITTSVRSDPQVLRISGQCRFSLIPYHQARMLDAARCFGWVEVEKVLEGPKGIQNLEDALETYWTENIERGTVSNSKCYKIRVLLSLKGQFLISAFEIPEVSINNLFPVDLSTLGHSSQQIIWRVFVSSAVTIPSAFTKHKTTHRDVYDDVRKSIPAGTPRGQGFANNEIMSEILLVNAQGEIMEGSITTPYFSRDGNWITPAAASGGNIGTTRRWALERSLCIEGIMRAEDVVFGELIWLSNGARGWGLGIIAEKQQD